MTKKAKKLPQYKCRVAMEDDGCGQYDVLVTDNGGIQWWVVYTGERRKALIIANAYLRVGYKDDTLSEGQQ